MTGFVTSYAVSSSSRQGGSPTVTHIEIPLIQRDYAQGEPDARTAEIRGLPRRPPRRGHRR